VKITQRLQNYILIKNANIPCQDTARMIVFKHRLRMNLASNERFNMLASQIQSGRIYSWVVENDAKLLKGGRKGVAPNPFNDLVVTKRTVYKGQAATGERWLRETIALHESAGQVYTPSDRAPQHIATDNPCIVQSVATSELQVRIMSIERTKKEYFIDGKLATPAQLAIIAQYKGAPSKRNPLYAPVMFPYIHNLTNCEDDITALAFTPVAIASAKHVMA
jgi:hypothetical protein